MNQIVELLSRLSQGGVRFILVGGMAGVAHGSARLTQDLDIVYARDGGNLELLVSVLAPLSPYLRGVPPGLPFRFDSETLRRGLNFTLTTTLADLDLLGEITGGGQYQDLFPHAIPMELGDQRILVLDLPTLIRVKRAAGRFKDLDALAELEALLEERERLKSDLES